MQPLLVYKHYHLLSPLLACFSHHHQPLTTILISHHFQHMLSFAGLLPLPASENFPCLPPLPALPHTTWHFYWTSLLSNLPQIILTICYYVMPKVFFVNAVGETFVILQDYTEQKTISQAHHLKNWCPLWQRRTHSLVLLHFLFFFALDILRCPISHDLAYRALKWPDWRWMRNGF